MNRYDFRTNKALAIYDFDHTLCHSNGRVNVKNTESNDYFKLTAQEYTDFREENKDVGKFEFDFSDFRGKPKEGKPITWTFNKLKRDLDDPNCTVALVTGRDELSGPEEWLKSQGIDTSKMILMCSGSPDKTFCYETLLINVKPENVEIYEDGYPYVDQCIAVCQKYGVTCEAYIVTQDIIENHKTGSLSYIIART